MVLRCRFKGQTYLLPYEGKKETQNSFLRFLATSYCEPFMEDYPRMMKWAVEMRRLNLKDQYKKPPKISGYAMSQWMRVIYGYPMTNTIGPLIAMLDAQIHPEDAKHLTFKKSKGD